jgi:hypothetical protein
MCIDRYKTFKRALPVILMVLTGITLSCSKEQFNEIGTEINRQNSFEIVGYGYVRLSPNASSNQITLARQRARMQAANNLAAHISGIEFAYDKRNKQTVTLDKFQAHTRGTIKGATTEYYPAGKSAILVKQTLRIKKANPTLPRTTHLKTSFRTDDMAKSLMRTYREAVAYTISRKFTSRKSATGKIYLAHMLISDHKGSGSLKVTLELRITVN